MPTLSRYFIKLGFGYLVAGLAMMIALAAQPIISLPIWVMSLRPVSVHLLVIGWLTQLIMGVAYWMFPKYSQALPRGNERLGWFTLISLNSGLLLRTIGEPLQMMYPQGGLGWILVVASILLLVGGCSFALNTWGRVKER